MAILNQAADSYKGKYNSWDWVASRMLVLPTSSSLSLAKATLLGRGTKLADEPKLDTVLPLPQALITYVRKTVNPNSYGQGEQIRPENIAAYLDLCVNTFQNRSLYGTICEDNGIKDANFARIRSLFIKYATKSAAAGFRGKVERDLTKRIGA
jgi:hypothetical protein